MKRLGGLWSRVVSFQNLYQAYRRARRGKGRRPDVARFELDLEKHLWELHEELVEGRYVPGAYRLFTIYDRKARTIAAAPFRDRVAHHALMDVVEPELDRRFIHDCYACRAGKGVHRAVDRYQQWARRYAYALKLDVQGYFPSVDHDILKAKLRRLLKDREILTLFDTIIDASPPATREPPMFPGDDLVTLMERRVSLPIGNLTSQFFGNLYLNDLDHFIKEQLGVAAYLRYVDDLILLGDNKAELWRRRTAIEEFLEGERLCIHPKKVLLTPVSSGVEVLGYRVYPGHRRLRRDNGYRYRRRLRALGRGYALGDLELTDVTASVAAWIGHVQHADSYGLRRAVLGMVCFQRGSGRGRIPACVARRRLEQQTAEPAVGEPQQEHRR